MSKFKAKFKYDDDTIEISNEGSTVEFDSTWLEETIVLLPDEALEIAAALVSAANAATKKKQNTYIFTLQIEGVDDLSMLSDALYKSGCDDALVYMEGEKYYVDFNRESESLEKAVAYATRDVLNASPDLVAFRIDR